MVPHIYKQEIYAGKAKKVEDADGSVIDSAEEMKKNYSPVNFFDFDYKLYPLLVDVDTRYTVVLRAGDCMYIPSYYFHSYVGKEVPGLGVNRKEDSEEKPGILGVMLKYKSHSWMLD